MVDAVRRDDPPPPTGPTTGLEAREDLAEQLRALGADGTLVACGRTAFTLPELDEREPPPCGDDQTTVELPQGEVERAARLHPTVPDRIERLRALVDGVARLSDTRVAAAISIRLGGRFERLGPLSTIAFFENGRLVASEPYFRVTGGRLAASPLGTYVTQTPDVILRRDGSQVSLPQHLRDASDLAWSPDERFVALAGRFAVTVVEVTSLERYDLTGGGLRTVTIPQAAPRLAWR